MQGIRNVFKDPPGVWMKDTGKLDNVYVVGRCGAYFFVPVLDRSISDTAPSKARTRAPPLLIAPIRIRAGHLGIDVCPPGVHQRPELGGQIRAF